MTGVLGPLPWIVRHARLLPENSTVLDIACGAGRHSLLLAGQGHRVTAVDIDLAALRANPGAGQLTLIEADMENGPWPFARQQFDAVVVTNYLWRPLLPAIIAAVRPGGVLLYETFMRGNEKYGRPANPDFLLKPDELRDLLEADFDILAFEQGLRAGARPAVKQSVAARRKK